MFTYLLNVCRVHLFLLFVLAPLLVLAFGLPALACTRFPICSLSVVLVVDKI